MMVTSLFFYSDGLVDFEAQNGCEDGYLYLKEFLSPVLQNTRRNC